jgi:hypothetical protein
MSEPPRAGASCRPQPNSPFVHFVLFRGGKSDSHKEAQNAQKTMPASLLYQSQFDSAD